MLQSKYTEAQIIAALKQVEGRRMRITRRKRAEAAQNIPATKIAKTFYRGIQAQRLAIRAVP